MKINLSPQRRDDKLTVEKNGDRLLINGDLFNFNPLPDGATITPGATECAWIVGPVERINGKIELTLILPHGANPSQGVAFPEPLEDVQDGIVALPFDPEPEPPVMPVMPDEEPANVVA
ncbi:hypothetical protein G6L37_13660 [Agrobacterium rubi]|uniref:hypothetical protein n=1 Tax=Agrobacterium rubi TaxID=28099 RepID=UPI001571A6AD|nr:hypothetical protein [Agrobacterium rubi]NTF07194.1 hypothetical protein [Agrobacterium rubi]NTF19450.1 hypothetical protein [Agrobacterium rubi]NTF26413.1 hypothetical protein [Agrobacterium rubi]